MAISKEKATVLTRAESALLRRLEQVVDEILKENYLPNRTVDIEIQQLTNCLREGQLTHRLLCHLIERYRNKKWEVHSSAGESALMATLHFK